MREKIYNVIEPKRNETKLSIAYDVVMILVILLSFVPLVFKTPHAYFRIIDIVCVTIFIIDYILRWITADYRYGKKGVVPFIRYPFSLMAIIDLLTILPSIITLNKAFKTLRVIRLTRVLRVLRIVRMFRYSKNIQILKNVYVKQRQTLLIVLVLVVGYVFITAMIIFQAEPATFGDFFDALYWATISLTTIGYGDIYTVTTVGKVITMVSSLVGVAVIALPAGIITAGYMHETDQNK